MEQLRCTGIGTGSIRVRVAMHWNQAGVRVEVARHERFPLPVMTVGFGGTMVPGTLSEFGSTMGGVLHGSQACV